MGGFRAQSAVGGFRARSGRLLRKSPRTSSPSRHIQPHRQAAHSSNPNPSLAPHAQLAHPHCHSVHWFASTLVLVSPRSGFLSAVKLCIRHVGPLLSALGLQFRASPFVLAPTPTPLKPPPSTLHCPHPQPLLLPFLPLTAPTQSPLSHTINPGPCPYHSPSPLRLQSPQDRRFTPPLPPDPPSASSPLPLRSQINAFIASTSRWARAPGRISGPSMFPQPEPVNEQSCSF